MLLAIPVLAQSVELSGEYAPLFHEDFPERIPGPEIGDYLGLPITDAARLRADSWDAALLSLPEHQCKPHPSDYGPRGPANLRFWKDVDTATQRTIAWHTHISWQAPERTIWMDGRPHPPPYAAHTWQGFSTGRWENGVLIVTTTHLKNGWIRRNGIPRSEKATLTEHWIRHGDYLTLVSIVNDPVYLTEPFIRTTDWVVDPRQQIAPYPCEAVVEVPRPKGTVPHHLPGTNPFLKEFPERFNIPAEATRGGLETSRPEYRPGASSSATAARNAAAAPPQNSPDGEIHALHVQGNVYMLVGPSSNLAVQVGKDGVLAVDTELGAQAAKVAAAIEKLTKEPIRYIVNTSSDPDHVGGNEALAKIGKTIVGGNVVGGLAGTSVEWPATIVAHENVLNRMSASGGSQPAAPVAAWPTDTYFADSKDLYLNGEAIQLYSQRAAHSDGDSLVFFRRSDVVATGEIFVPNRYPVIDVARGGSINGIVDALNRILDLTVPAEKQEGGTMVIPGHGRLCDEADVVEYRDMITIIRDRIEDMVRKGMTLEQVKAARPTQDYDPLYGPSDAFVEAAYRSLNTPVSR
jgi:glyoxylase-like metal-dependent hydrolase (beta-lactamase superfamily II)